MISTTTTANGCYVLSLVVGSSQHQPNQPEPNLCSFKMLLHIFVSLYTTVFTSDASTCSGGQQKNIIYKEQHPQT